MSTVAAYINRLIGMSGLAALACYLLWLLPHADGGMVEVAHRAAQSAVDIAADRHRRHTHPGDAGDVQLAAGKSLADFVSCW